MLNILSSCQPHDPLCVHHNHGTTIVVYDWSDAPEANVKGTRVYFYRSEDGNRIETENFSGMKGGSIYLSEGNYDVVCYNNDTDKLFWRGADSKYSIEGYTRKASLTEDLPGFSYEEIPGLVLTPNRLWCGESRNIHISENDTNIIVLKPRLATYQLTWRVKNVKGAKRVSACVASIDGVAGSMFAYGLNTGKKDAVMSGIGRYDVPLAKESDGCGDFTGQMELFGCDFLDDCKHTFTIYCWSGGGNVKASYDVTDQFHCVFGKNEIYVEVEADFEIPSGNGGNGGGGFNPGVGNWNEEHHEIIL